MKLDITFGPTFVQCSMLFSLVRLNWNVYTTPATLNHVVSEVNVDTNCWATVNASLYIKSTDGNLKMFPLFTGSNYMQYALQHGENETVFIRQWSVIYSCPKADLTVLYYFIGRTNYFWDDEIMMISVLYYIPLAQSPQIDMPLHSDILWHQAKTCHSTLTDYDTKLRHATPLWHIMTPS
jgi:hypothetical protein